MTRSGTFWVHYGKVDGKWSDTEYCSGANKPAPIELLKEPWPCPWCGSEKVMAEGSANRLAMVCQKCLARGPEFQKTDGENWAIALKLWNQRTL